MIGGYYVVVTEVSEAHAPREYTALVAGPFATWAEADAVGPQAVAHVKANSGTLTKPEFGICEFYYHRLILGIRNTPLWVTPSPVERN